MLRTSECSKWENWFFFFFFSFSGIIHWKRGFIFQWGGGGWASFLIVEGGTPWDWGPPPPPPTHNMENPFIWGCFFPVSILNFLESQVVMSITTVAFPNQLKILTIFCIDSDVNLKSSFSSFSSDWLITTLITKSS